MEVLKEIPAQVRDCQKRILQSSGMVPDCQIIQDPDSHCTRGRIESAHCSTCGENVRHEIIR